MIKSRGAPADPEYHDALHHRGLLLEGACGEQAELRRSIEEQTPSHSEELPNPERPHSSAPLRTNNDQQIISQRAALDPPCFLAKPTRRPEWFSLVGDDEEV